MPQPAFNPVNEVQFDLAQGRISLGPTASRVMVPAEALASLAASAGAEAVKDFGRNLGTEIGRRAASRLVDGADRASVAAVVEQFGGDLALAGFGSLSAERWGRALVLRVAGSPLGPAGDVLLGAVLEGAIQRGLGRDTALVRLERSEGAVRWLATNATTASRVEAWLDQGTSWGQVLARLNEGS